MGARLRLWGQQIKTYPVATGLIALVIALVVLVILGGYLFHWDWTGFNGDIKSGKTLWDWLQLLGVLAIPVAVALGTQWFTTKQSQESDKENKDNQHEAALQAYIDKMSELLLHEKLRESTEDEEVRKIARVRTLTLLQRCDAERKASVLLFLHESGLIDKDKRIIDLDGADLSEALLVLAKLSRADLRKANLVGADLAVANLENANLAGAKLCHADLSSANLNKANLENADLSEAILRGTNLKEAILSGAELVEADLSGLHIMDATKLDGTDKIRDAVHSVLGGANLNKADLFGADLSGANLSNVILDGVTGTNPEQLAQAKSLKGAIMPNGSIHP